MIPTGDARPTFGYLLVVEDDANGCTGGLLTVCDRGRPLEFHCTEPIRPSRAQEILFGPTLRPYLYGERIGSALLAKAKLPIGCLLVRDADSACAGQAAGLPTVMLAEGDPPSEVRRLAESIDPSEPFDRVHEAILETLRVITNAAEDGSRVAA